jgi:hypothetical protein
MVNVNHQKLEEANLKHYIEMKYGDDFTSVENSFEEISSEAIKWVKKLQEN